MPRISTDNYDTVASWNGSEDLFIVEQPDGTKVATPAMVKQFIETGDFVATGEVGDGHGNILADMAKSADVATALAGKQDTLTFDNVPTENSNNPVESGGIFSMIANKVKSLPIVDRNYTCTSANFEYTGVNMSCPAGHTYIVRVQISYSNSKPTGLLASSSSSNMEPYVTYAYNTNASFITFMLTAGQMAYIWGRWEASRQNAVRYWIVDITN